MKWKNWVVLGVLALVLLFALLPLLSGAVWDGGFPQAEFRLRFVDGKGRPISGVVLRVEDESGRLFYHYPVSDYGPGHAPTSDADGVLTFHHATTGSLEYGGRCWSPFGLLEVGDCHGPVYVCRFLKGGREVHRCRYDELAWAAYDSGESAERDWDWSNVAPRFAGPASEVEDWLSRRREEFQHPDAEISIEERAAWQAWLTIFEKVDSARRQGQPAVDALKFPVVSRTVVIGMAAP
jgi:hypothetical protein